MGVWIKRLSSEMIVRPTSCSWRRAAPREMMRGRRPPRYSEEARKPPAPPTPIMSISGSIPPPWYKLCCTTLPVYRNQVTEHSIGCLYDAWFVFHYRDCTHSFGFERDDTCCPCADMQGVIRANAAWSNVRDEHAMFAMCLAHQADGRPGQRGCADFIRGQVTDALTLDHLRSELTLKQRICQDSRLHHVIPAVQVIPGIGLCHADVLRSTDGLVS